MAPRHIRGAMKQNEWMGGQCPYDTSSETGCRQLNGCGATTTTMTGWTGLVESTVLPDDLAWRQVEGWMGTGEQSREVRRGEDG